MKPSAIELPLIAQARNHGDRVAIVAPDGTYTFRELLAASQSVASALLRDTVDLNEQRVAFLIPPGFQYVAVQWGIWRAGGLAVPVSVSHPPPELEYVIADADAELVIAHSEFANLLRPVAEKLSRRFFLTTGIFSTKETDLPRLALSRRAMMLYTSGTTNRPKGVVTTHGNLHAQVSTLVSAWEWRAEDRALLVLPLHHVHGIVNVLACALYAGAACEVLPRFDADAVWEKFLAGAFTVFMAVPTIYTKLIAAWERATVQEQRAMSNACAKMRLMVSGSAALPVRVLEKWQSLSGQILLERYGMTETGMILSNPLRGERRPGFVGTPLPNVEVRLVDEQGHAVSEGQPGEVQVKGPSVFLEYWRKPEAMATAFHDGWFCTGDIAAFENGSYRIWGRRSIDIIKTGGYKVSALEIEDVLRQHPEIAECAVFGLDDAEWGERVCAALVLQEGNTMALENLRHWCVARLAVYKIPTRLFLFETLPRNALGKIIKTEIKKLALNS